MNNKNTLTITSRGIIIFILVLLVFILHFINKPMVTEKTSAKVFDLKNTESGLLRYNEISVEQVDDSAFTFINNHNEGDTLSYAWYIIDKADGTAVFKGNYSSNNQFTHTFVKDGTFIVRAYAKTSTERSSLDIAEVICNKGEYQVILYGDIQVDESLAK